MRRGLQREKVGRRNRRHGRTGEVLHVPRDDVFAAGFLGGNRDNGVLVVGESKLARFEKNLSVAGNDGNALVENQAEGVILAGAVTMAVADVNAGRDRMGGQTPRQLSGQGLFDDLQGRFQELLPLLKDVYEDVEVDQDFHAYFSTRCFLYSSLSAPSVLSQCNEPMALRRTSGMSSSSHSATARDSLSFARHWRMTSETEMPYWAAYPWTKVRSALGSRTIRRESFMDDPFWMYDSLTNMYDDGQVGVILDDCEENR